MDPDEHSEFVLERANLKHVIFANEISSTMEESARQRGTGISKRSPELIRSIILEGRAILAVHTSGRWAGFCYLNEYDSGKFISCSGLIVSPEFRDHGIAGRLKHYWFELCRKEFPTANLIGITTSPAVMKINTSLGFYPTSFAEMPQEEKFWKGCESCVNHDILVRTERKFCLCTAMKFTAHHALRKTA